jgi:hypothetical protein
VDPSWLEPFCSVCVLPVLGAAPPAMTPVGASDPFRAGRLPYASGLLGNIGGPRMSQVARLSVRQHLSRSDEASGGVGCFADRRVSQSHDTFGQVALGACSVSRLGRGQQRCDLVAQFRHLDGFRQVGGDACLACVGEVSIGGGGRDEQDRYVGSGVCTYRFGELDAVEAGHEEVGHDQVELVVVMQVGRCRAVSRHIDGVAGPLEDDGERVPDVRLIIDDKDARHFHYPRVLLLRPWCRMAPLALPCQRREVVERYVDARLIEDDRAAMPGLERVEPLGRASSPGDRMAPHLAQSDRGFDE